jgi:ArsR family transcriptional regulator
MTNTDAARALSALGHEARLDIFRLLVRAEPDGLNIGEIGRLVGAPPSTLAHHLGALVRAGLVSQEKQGREVINRARTDAMRRVFAFVEDECCRGVSSTRDDAA